MSRSTNSLSNIATNSSAAAEREWRRGQLHRLPKRRWFTEYRCSSINGDVCQSVTDLAIEVGTAISTHDFRTLNRCLDDAIAGAVTEYAHEHDVTRGGASHELQHLTNIAITAFEVLQTGNVGIGGSTGAVVYRSLMAIRAALADRPVVQRAQEATEGVTH
jgi:hypothetical protein